MCRDKGVEKRGEEEKEKEKGRGSEGSQVPRLAHPLATSTSTRGEGLFPLSPGPNFRRINRPHALALAMVAVLLLASTVPTDVLFLVKNSC